MVEYKFEIGDIVRCDYSDVNLIGTIVGREARGGGCDQDEPLYWVRSNSEQFSSQVHGRRDNNMEGRFHDMWLTLVKRGVNCKEDDGKLTIDTSLL